VADMIAKMLDSLNVYGPSVRNSGGGQEE